jgi:hypothetical protein
VTTELVAFPAWALSYLLDLVHAASPTITTIVHGMYLAANDKYHGQLIFCVALLRACIDMFMIYLVIGLFIEWNRASARMLGRGLLWVKSGIMYLFSSDLDCGLRGKLRHVEFRGFDSWTDAHSHPTAAMIRNQLNAAIDRLITSNGFNEYSVSMSNADEKRLMYGNRMYHTAKDVAYRMRYDTLPHNAVIKLSDVDFYMDDLEELLYTGKPILMQTIVPTKAAGAVPDGYLTTNPDNTISMTVMGGAKYRHGLWQYDGDHIIVRGTLSSVVYLVESICHPIDPERRIVGLFPMRRVYGPWGLLGLLRGDELSRRQLVHPTGLAYVRSMQLENEVATMVMSLAEPTSTICTTLPEAVIYACHQRYVNAALRTEVGSIESVIQAMLNAKVNDKLRYPKFAATTDYCTAAFHILDLFKRYPLFFNDKLLPFVTVPPFREHNYTVLPRDVPLLDDPKESMRAIFTDVGKETAKETGCQQPWVTTAVSPTQCKLNEKACIEGRVDATVNSRRPPPKYDQYATEFINALVGDKRHTLVPQTFEQAAERQTTPSQKNIMARAAMFLGVHSIINRLPRVSAFQKREAYGKVTHPRNISTVEGPQKWSFARYTYQISDWMKQFSWYAFGRTPLGIAKRVNDVCRGARNVKVTDFGKFDGRHSKWLAEKEEQLYLSLFGPLYHQELSSLHWKNFGLNAVTRHGVRYKTGFSRLSGSMDTSIANTFNNVLLAYIAFREDDVPHEEAMKMLGVYGGDDGLTPDVSQAQYERVAVKVGMELKAETIQRGAPVPFLGRYFTNPWVIDGLNSICDIPRQAQKLHLTTASTLVSNEAALYRKASGYILTDRYTPIIGPWAEHVMQTCSPGRVAGVDEELMQRELSWWAAESLKSGASEHFPQATMGENLSVAAKLWAKECNMTEERLIWANSTASRDYFPTSTEPAFKRNVQIGVRAVLGTSIVEPPTTPRRVEDSTRADSNVVHQATPVPARPVVNQPKVDSLRGRVGGHSPGTATSHHASKSTHGGAAQPTRSGRVGTDRARPVKQNSGPPPSRTGASGPRPNTPALSSPKAANADHSDGSRPIWSCPTCGQFDRSGKCGFCTKKCGKCGGWGPVSPCFSCPAETSKSLTLSSIPSVDTRMSDLSEGVGKLVIA